MCRSVGEDCHEEGQVCKREFLSSVIVLSICGGLLVSGRSTCLTLSGGLGSKDKGQWCGRFCGLK